tara:strand:- start:218 stop:721 length:504 start_codon:yes stop_codon:yes gene_type:complete
MLRIYALIFVIAIIGGIGYGAKYYYDTTQATIATLRDNNAKLETAVDTAEQSVATLKGDIAKMGELNNKLQISLQKAEAYGDELRQKLSDLDLVVEALKDSKVLEGKMNGATAKLWREFMGDTGGNSDRSLPKWLQQFPAGTGNKGSDKGGEGTNTDSGKTETTPTQ